MMRRRREVGIAGVGLLLVGVIGSGARSEVRQSQEASEIALEDAVLSAGKPSEDPDRGDPREAGLFVPMSRHEARETVARRLDASDFSWEAAQARGLARAVQGLLRDTRIESLQLVDAVGDLESALRTAERLSMGPVVALNGFFTPRLKNEAGDELEVAGRLEGPAGKAHAAFVADDNRLEGVVEGPTGRVEIVALGDGLHAITRLLAAPRDRMLDDVEPAQGSGSGVLDFSDADSARDDRDSVARESTMSAERCRESSAEFAIDVVVGVTELASREAASISRNVVRRAQLHVVASNVTFANSNIPGQVQLAGWTDVDFAEDPGDSSFSNEIAALREGKASVARLLAAKQNAAADVAVLVVHKTSEVHCGRAGGIGVTAKDAFVAVNWKCMDERWSFIHEIGHLVGAWHNPEAVASSSRRNPPFAHGYCSSDGKFATIMANSTQCGQGWRKEWYWSNPDVKDEKGVATGTSEMHNNACVWRIRGPRVAAFGTGR